MSTFDVDAATPATTLRSADCYRLLVAGRTPNLPPTPRRAEQEINAFVRGQ